ncbi:hypothetical protein B0H21DRAFT_708673 [Amylocystis lapponica]|nr:hypothetical protein B0H21DRAFT_708673 [Amylocystis lapponica]
MVVDYSPLHVPLSPKDISQFSTLTGAMGTSAPCPESPPAESAQSPKTIRFPAIELVLRDILSQGHEEPVVEDACAEVFSDFAFKALTLKITWPGYAGEDFTRSVAIKPGGKHITRLQLAVEIAKRFAGFMQIVENIVCTKGPEWTLGVGHLDLARLALVSLENVGPVFYAKVERLWPEP